MTLMMHAVLATRSSETIVSRSDNAETAKKVARPSRHLTAACTSLASHASHGMHLSKAGKAAD